MENKNRRNASDSLSQAAHFVFDIWKSAAVSVTKKTQFLYILFTIFVFWATRGILSLIISALVFGLVIPAGVALYGAFQRKGLPMAGPTFIEFGKWAMNEASKKLGGNKNGTEHKEL